MEDFQAVLKKLDNHARGIVSNYNDPQKGLQAWIIKGSKKGKITAVFVRGSEDLGDSLESFLERNGALKESNSIEVRTFKYGWACYE